MEPYGTYEDVGAFFFVLVFLDAVVRLAVRANLLRASGRIQAGRFKPGAAELDHSFTGYRSVRNPQVALSRAGDVAVRLDASQQVLHRGFIVSGIASALCITFFIRLRPHVMPTIPAMDFVVLSLFLGPILEESVFRSHGCCSPRSMVPVGAIALKFTAEALDAGCPAGRLLPQPTGLDYERFQCRQRFTFNGRSKGGSAYCGRRPIVLKN
jgi:hypothetical protein